jgi:hypothetical protein
LIGNGKHHLIPSWQPLAEEGYKSARRKNSTGAGEKASVALSTLSKRQGASLNGKVIKGPNPNRQAQKGQLLTQHTGLPPRKKS